MVIDKSRNRIPYQDLAINTANTTWTDISLLTIPECKEPRNYALYAKSPQQVSHEDLYGPPLVEVMNVQVNTGAFQLVLAHSKLSVRWRSGAEANKLLSYTHTSDMGRPEVEHS
ncbi:hypothetical protein J6590_061843 [Homalodisca vitripennis]|nr:hypothetical protein J6590_061843 [Homalodisca vitripennis]